MPGRGGEEKTTGVMGSLTVASPIPAFSHALVARSGGSLHPFDEGFEAARGGESLLRNPYWVNWPKASGEEDLARRWVDGWVDGVMLEDRGWAE